MHPVGSLLIALLLPVALALALVASEALVAPSHAERRNRARSVWRPLDRVEKAAGCVVGIGVLAMLVGALAYLWENRPPW